MLYFIHCKISFDVYPVFKHFVPPLLAFHFSLFTECLFFISSKAESSWEEEAGTTSQRYVNDVNNSTRLLLPLLVLIYF